MTYLIYLHYLDEKGRKRNSPVSTSYFLPKSKDQLLAWLHHHLQMGLMRHRRLARLVHGSEEFEIRVNRNQAFGDRAGFHPVGWFIVNFRRGTIYVKKKYSGVKAIPGLPDRLQPYFKRSDRTLFDRLNEKHIVSFGPESSAFRRHKKFFDEDKTERDRRLWRELRFRRFY
jgi:hypothetical protein